MPEMVSLMGVLSSEVLIVEYADRSAL